MMMFSYGIKMLSCLFLLHHPGHFLQTPNASAGCYFPLEEPCCLSPGWPCSLRGIWPFVPITPGSGLLPSQLSKGSWWPSTHPWSLPIGSEGVCISFHSSTFHPECLLTCRGRFSTRKPHTSLLEHCVSTVFGSKTFDLLTTKAAFPRGITLSLLESKGGKRETKPCGGLRFNNIHFLFSFCF